ncbi:MAG: CoB--CoM heterodisulfide reductase iron-sulfur subunit B family protein [Desulfobacteraceae bacterium]|nr:CoB--CoM heterodisulfide reductase iron-sulfur subunit B family protein [Desulfobacteraceae bacterium]
MGNLRYAYYPGCASQEITKEANKTTLRVAKALEIELLDMPSVNCCGAGLMGDFDRELALAMNARIFAKAEEMGLDILTICSTCLMVMRSANKELTEDPKLLKKINELLSAGGIEYKGTIKITHLLWALTEDYGLEELKKKVTRPLEFLKAAPFYGCHTLRPSKALGFDDPENPTSLENALRVLGAKVVDFDGKTKCCGFQVDLVSEETAVDMTTKRLLSAKDEGADCMVTPCPFCHINLDNYQGLAEKRIERKIELPVFHFSQVVGLALGMSTKELGLSRHLVSPEKVLK